MKKKFIIFTLCFTLIFSSLNYKRTYADGGVLSLPMLATVSSLAVGTGIIIKNSDDLYDIGRLFYDYVKNHNSYTWESVKLAFASVSALPSGFVSVDSPFLNIVKDFFDNTFNDDKNVVLEGFNDNNFPSKVLNVPIELLKGSYSSSLGSSGGYVVGDMRFILSSVSINTNTTFYILRASDDKLLYSSGTWCRQPYFNYVVTGLDSDSNRLGFKVDFIKSSGEWVDFLYSLNSTPIVGGFADFPYSGGYSWEDSINDKIENDRVSLPIPGNLDNLIGQDKDSFWGNTDDLVGVGGISLPSVSNPSIDVSQGTFVGGDIVNPDVPGDSVVPDNGIWSTIKDFIISLVVPSDTFWTDTWGGLYNNFINSFPMVDMDGFNDLVTGEKKFPNIDIDVMGVTGRVVNGDVVNSIVNWLRPIIAGFMMICLMFFNYRKLYKLIRNSEPFEGIGKVENHAN